jgi:hypothetical protein
MLNNLRSALSATRVMLLQSINMIKPSDVLIQPEIIDDSFSFYLKQITQNTNLKNFLEIGASSGQGSTKTLVNQINLRSDKDLCRYFAIEVSEIRHKALMEYFQQYKFFRAFNTTSVAITKYPSHFEVIFFYIRHKTNLNKYPLAVILLWLVREKKYLKSKTNIVAKEDGISEVQKKFDIDKFDFVLIDGSEFTGFEEMLLIYGALVICLDDTNSFKNYKTYQYLKKSQDYQLYVNNPLIRNGFAIFIHKSVAEDFR